MRRLLAKGLILLATGRVRAQIGTPPPCPDAVIDRETFLPHRRAIKFHLRFHVGSDRFDARSIIERRRHESPATSCSDAEVVDRLIAELIRERNLFWPR